MQKKIALDPALLFLLLGNLYVIWYYQSNPGSFNTIIWIYWCQSMIIGLFNFVYLLTGNSKTTNLSAPEGGKTLSSGCGAIFFLFH